MSAPKMLPGIFLCIIVGAGACIGMEPAGGDIEQAEKGNALLELAPAEITAEEAGSSPENGTPAAMRSQPPSGGRLLVARFNTGTVPPAVMYWENWGSHQLFDGWHDQNDDLLIGDFMDLGYDQALFFNKTNAGDGRVLITDFRSGQPPATVRYWENWGQSLLLNGWQDSRDIAVAGAFVGDPTQVLFINRG